ncbi:hypothetical protein AB0C77_06660 [Streptomyces sp. NPDC048629]|uniref:hypothetical protein n=1 Tax=Streptomyces sp. NPDC048629 TaxID=3154824 RepID=UPI003441E588
MGYARYEIHRNGEKIEAGYDVETSCEEDGCEEGIDRGLAHLCGETPGGDEHGCGGYYCGSHLYLSGAEQVGDLCGSCIATYKRDADR